MTTPRTERKKLVEAALKARRGQALTGEATWCSVGSDMRCSDTSRDPTDWCDTCLALAAADLLEGERERKPDGFLVYPSDSQMQRYMARRRKSFPHDPGMVVEHATPLRAALTPTSERSDD